MVGHLEPDRDELADIQIDHSSDREACDRNALSSATRPAKKTTQPAPRIPKGRERNKVVHLLQVVSASARPLMAEMPTPPGSASWSVSPAPWQDWF